MLMYPMKLTSNYEFFGNEIAKNVTKLKLFYPHNNKILGAL